MSGGFVRGRLRAWSPMRLTIPGLGAVVVVARGDQMAHAEACPDLARLGELPADERPALVTRFFGATLFHNSVRDTWFVPFSDDADPAVAARRQSIGEALDRGYSPEDVDRVIEALRRCGPEPDERSICALARVVTDVVNHRFFGVEPPAQVIADARAALDSPGGLLNPIAARRAREAQARVLEFCGGDIDHGHNVGAIARKYTAVLLRLAVDPTREVEAVLAGHPPTPTVPRVTLRRTTLDGLLRRAVPRGSVVFYLIGGEATRTGDMRFVFGHGTDHRVCLFRQFAIDFLRDVQRGLTGG